jgi:hypothetical protein
MSNTRSTRSSRNSPRTRGQVLRAAVAVAMGAAGLLSANLAQAQLKADAQSLWPHWEGRVGVLDLPTNTTLQPVNLSSPFPTDGLKLQTKRAQPDYYLGAGYTAKLPQPSGYSSWRFNADLGLISLNSSNIDRITRVFQGDQGVDALIRELRLRPVVKFSVNYAF